VLTGTRPAAADGTLEAYLRCGVLEHGFLREVCEHCHAERLVAIRDSHDSGRVLTGTRPARRPDAAPPRAPRRAGWIDEVGGRVRGGAGPV